MEKLQLISYGPKAKQWVVQYGEQRRSYPTFTEAVVAMLVVSDAAILDLNLLKSLLSECDVRVARK